jgi:DNA ligase-associated metallophosphoesterase
MEQIFGGEQVLLLPEKALWLTNLKSLVVADVHWGKIDHFRKSGIPVPLKGNDKNAEQLISLINLFKPKRVIFLGDLFHSVYNDGWETFGQVRKAFVHCSFELVIGNHDILSQRQYERHNILLHRDSLDLNNLLLTHEPLEEIPEKVFNIAGHVHPGAHLRGTAKQSVILPCFYIKSNQCILPAFGAFTGLATIQPKVGDKIFVVANGNVMATNES